MLISLFRYLQGYVKIRVTGYSPERFLNLCKNKKILIWGLESACNAYEMYIKVSGFRRLKPILKKTQTKVAILERFGLPFFFHKYRKRKLFFISIGFCLMLIYSLTFFIWNIDFDGNRMITDEVLLEYLDSQHISHGMVKRKVDCEQIAKDIRRQFDDIIWVSVSMEGTRLFVHVKENTDTFELKQEEELPCDIIADKTGIVLSIVTRSGIPQVQVGDEVVEGDLLVSGMVDVMNDAGEVATQNYVTADADIVLETVYHYEDVISKKYKNKVYTDKKRKVWCFHSGKFLLSLGIQKNSFECYEQHTDATQLKLGENFYLPIFIGKKEILEYEWETLEYSKEEMDKLLNKRFEQFCQKLEEQGAIITEKNLQITHDTSGGRAESVIMLQEEAGINRKIIDF